MAIITSDDNLNKFGVKNGQAYEGRIGFRKDAEGDEVTCVKWYQVKGYRGAQLSTFYNEGKTQAYGQDLVTIH